MKKILAILALLTISLSAQAQCQSGNCGTRGGWHPGKFINRFWPAPAVTQYAPAVTPAPVVPPVQPDATVGAQEEKLGRLFTRVAVHRELKKAMNDPSLPAEHRAAAAKIMADDDAYEAVVSKARADLNKAVQSGTTVGKGGTLLAQLLAWITSPAGQNFIMTILKLFGL